MLEVKEVGKVAGTVLERQTEDVVAGWLTEYAKTRDSTLRDLLVMAYQGLVRFLAGKFTNRGEEMEDLVQVGNIGLINAIDRFDPMRGTKFSTYVTPTIVGEIRRHFRDKAWSLKVPRRLQELSLAINKASKRLAQNLGRQPTITEIANEVHTTEKKTLEAIELGKAYDTISLDTYLVTNRESAPITLAEFLGDVDLSLQTYEQYGDLFEAIDRLESRQRTIIHCRFFKDMTQTEVAKRLNISQMHVSRLQEKALQCLQKLLLDWGEQPVRRDEEMGKQRSPNGRIKSSKGNEPERVVIPQPQDLKSPCLDREKTRLALTIYKHLPEDSKNAELDFHILSDETGIDFESVRHMVPNLCDQRVIKRVRGKHWRSYRRGGSTVTIDNNGSQEPFELAPGVWVNPGEKVNLADLAKNGSKKIPRERKGGRPMDKASVGLGQLNILLAINPDEEEYRAIDYSDLESKTDLDRNRLYSQVNQLTSKGLLERDNTGQCRQGPNKEVRVLLVHNPLAKSKQELTLPSGFTIHHNTTYRVSDLLQVNRNTEIERVAPTPMTDKEHLKAVIVNLESELAEVESQIQALEDKKTQITSSLEKLQEVLTQIG